jgi:peptidoglycan hydrolase CwlO-like protein
MFHFKNKFTTMRKKHVLSTLLLSVTTSFGLLSFAACNTTDNQGNENNTTPTYQEEPDIQQNIEKNPAADTNNNGNQNYDGTKIKKGTLIDDTDSLKK